METIITPQQEQAITGHDFPREDFRNTHDGSGDIEAYSIEGEKLIHFYITKDGGSVRRMVSVAPSLEAVCTDPSNNEVIGDNGRGLGIYL